MFYVPCFMKIASHTVVGFPDLKTSTKIVEILAAHSAIVELQVPFSDPVADGPVIAAANSVALQNKITPQICLNFAAKISQKFPQTDFYLMTYFNPVFRFGITKFVKAAQKAGVKGFIIPDLPVEEAGELLKICRKNKLDLIFVVAPNISEITLRKIAVAARGWIYCVARLGITGSQTEFGKNLKKFLARVKRFTSLPLGVGFGVKSRKDLQQIVQAGGTIGILGSELFRQFEKGGLHNLERFLRILTK
ncbi:tryptophan synthase subunit alpha [Candidatus Gracilibacteria bacterium]|nr:tryptophan synthase subunit alpha [Candidatus Gracilibacteria bacterium]MCF7856083.1 tryptophan synthase subunit alpha [Candidatus Gracilibacteria bacterium]MCF7896502.1 tryptophan synthase subunit alpha [Candidatus Gracilibacteria bacterium]